MLLLYAPHLLMKKNTTTKKMFFDKQHDQYPCHLTLHAKLSPTPTSDKPSIYIYFLVYDNTRVITTPPSNSPSCHAFLTNPFTLRLLTNSSPFYSSLNRRAVRAMIPPDFPIEQCHRSYFESKIEEFVREVMETAKGGFNVTMYVASSIDRMVEYDEAVRIAEEIRDWVDVEEEMRLLMEEEEKTEIEAAIEREHEAWRKNLCVSG